MKLVSIYFKPDCTTLVSVVSKVNLNHSSWTQCTGWPHNMSFEYKEWSHFTRFHISTKCSLSSHAFLWTDPIRTSWYISGHAWQYTINPNNSHTGHLWSKLSSSLCGFVLGHRVQVGGLCVCVCVWVAFTLPLFSQKWKVLLPPLSTTLVSASVYCKNGDGGRIRPNYFYYKRKASFICIVSEMHAGNLCSWCLPCMVSSRTCTVYVVSLNHN